MALKATGESLAGSSPARGTNNNGDSRTSPPNINTDMRTHETIDELLREFTRLGLKPNPSLSDDELEAKWRVLSAASVRLRKKQEQRELNEFKRIAGL